MKIRTFCFIALLLITSSLAAEDYLRPSLKEIERAIPFWDANKEAFTHTHVFQCVGNEDNSLYLLNVVTDEGWHNIIYAFAPDSYFGDRRIYKIWDQSVSGGDVRSLVFSPFSKKFYFTAAWEHPASFVQDSEGLWIGTQRKKKYNEPILLNHQKMESGIGHLIVNKTGVWLLYDNEPNWAIENRWTTSSLYQLEDDKGRFIFQVPEAAKDLPFHSYWTFENPGNTRLIDNNIKNECQICFRNTDYTLIIRDKDVKSWWLFNCLTQQIEKYKSYNLALEEAIKIDKNK